MNQNSKLTDKELLAKQTKLLNEIFKELALGIQYHWDLHYVCGRIATLRDKYYD